MQEIHRLLEIADKMAAARRIAAEDGHALLAYLIGLASSEAEEKIAGRFGSPRSR